VLRPAEHPVVLTGDPQVRVGPGNPRGLLHAILRA